MKLSIELADRYAKTFLDFWLLRPRSFIAAKNRDPSRYLSPYQFLVACLGIALVIYIAAFSLSQSEIHTATGQPPVTSAEALAVRMLTFLVAVLLVDSLVIRAVSRIWPIRGGATFSSIFEFRCYMLAIWLPGMALDLLLGPWLLALVLQKILPAGSNILILATVGSVIGVFAVLFWWFPGVAVINGVSTRRVCAGVLFWPATLGAVFGILGFAYLVLFVR